MCTKAKLSVHTDLVRKRLIKVLATSGFSFISLFFASSEIKIQKQAVQIVSHPP